MTNDEVREAEERGARWMREEYEVSGWLASECKRCGCSGEVPGKYDDIPCPDCHGNGCFFKTEAQVCDEARKRECGE